MTHRTIQWLRLGLAVTLAGALIAIGVLVVDQFRQREDIVGQAKPDDGLDSTLSSIEGFEYSARLDDGTEFTFGVDRMAVDRKKFGPLTLNPLREVNLRRVRLEISVGSAGFALDSVIESVRKTLSARDMGAVVEIKIHGLEIRGHARDGTEFVLEADAAGVGLGSESLAFDDRLTFHSSAGDRLMARRAVWDRRSGRLVVRGPHFFNEDAVTRGDARTAYEIDFEGRLRRQ